MQTGSVSGGNMSLLNINKVATLTFCVIAAVALSCATARTETVDRIVANVNGEIILYSELQEQLKLQEKQTPAMNLSDPATRSKAEHDLLTMLIREKLTDAEIGRLKVIVTQSGGGCYGFTNCRAEPCNHGPVRTEAQSQWADRREISRADEEKHGAEPAHGAGAHVEGPDHRSAG